MLGRRTINISITIMETMELTETLDMMLALLSVTLLLIAMLSRDPTLIS